MNRTWAVCLFGLLVFTLCAPDLLAAQRGGGGGGRRGGGMRGGNGNGGNGNGGNGGMRQKDDPTDDKDNYGMKWEDTVEDATSAASKNQRPILVILSRDGNEADHKAIERLSSWPAAIELNKTGQLTIMELFTNQQDGEALVKRLNLKTFPAVAWLDNYGNAISGQALPDNVSFITGTVANWKTTLASIDKYFKDHIGRGDRMAAKSKFRDAYIEYSLVAPFKGPDGELARDGQKKVKEQWLKIVDAAATLPAGSFGRDAALKGLRKDTVGLDVVPALEGAITRAIAAANAPKPVAEVADAGNANAEKKADAAKAEDKPAAPVAAPEPPAAPSVAGGGMPNVESKGLAQLATASATSLGVSTSEREEELGVDTSSLSAKTDDRMKKADKLVQEGMASYRKALEDKTPRGPERNAMLVSARDKFETALTLMDEANKLKPDHGVDKLMEKISMMMYGCLKYQSL